VKFKNARIESVQNEHFHFLSDYHKTGVAFFAFLLYNMTYDADKNYYLRFL